MKKFKNPFDLRDLFVFVGLSMLFYGCFALYQPVAYVVVGAALFLVGMRKGS